MTLSTAATLAGCFSSLAIVTSLMFAIHQMHLGIRHEQAAARHGRVQQLQALYVQVSQGDFIDVVVRGLAGDTTMDGKNANRFVWFSVSPRRYPRCDLSWRCPVCGLLGRSFVVSTSHTTPTMWMGLLRKRLSRARPTSVPSGASW